jgi:hypothetical protein
MLSSWPINIPSFSLTEALLLADVIRSQVRRRKTRSDGIGAGLKVCVSEWKEADVLQTDGKGTILTIKISSFMFVGPCNIVYKGYINKIQSHQVGYLYIPYKNQ